MNGGLIYVAPARLFLRPLATHARILSLLAVAGALVGCASTPVSPLASPSVDTRGEVVVFREWAFAAGGVSLMVGAGDDTFASLKNSEKVRAWFPEGSHVIFVRAGRAEPTRVRIDVRRGGKVCLRTSSSPSTYAKVVVPIALMVSGYHFYLDEVPCPADERLAQYKDASVAYR